MIDWRTELRWAGFYIPAFTLITPLLVLLGRRVQRAEILRKIAHVLLVVGALPTIYLFKSPALVGALALLLEISLLLHRRIGALSRIFRAGSDTYGDLMIAPVLYCLWFAGQRNTALFVGPLLILALSDSAAAVVGSRFGRLKFSVAGTVRTLEGSLAHFVVSWIIVLVIGQVAQGDAVSLILRSGAVALVAAAAEAISPSGLDNLTAPLSAALLMVLVGVPT